MKRLALAIARDRTDLPNLGGTARFTSRGLAILHGPAPADAISPGLETVQAYAATVAAFHTRETVLPLRFGSLHDSEAGFDDWLRVRSDEWRGMLDQVEGCDEMGLRVLLDPPVRRPLDFSTVPADRPGTAYLAALKTRHDASDALMEEAARMTRWLQEALEGTFRRVAVEDPGPGRERLLSLAYLVPRPALESFRAAIGPLEQRSAGKLLLTGPWPPYNFAEPGMIQISS
jgi:hypothetical protein